MYLTTQEMLDAYRHLRQRQFADTTIEGGGSLSLAGHQLPHLDLRNVSLSEVNFTEANLDGAILVNVVCYGAQFQRASLKLASLHGPGQNLDGIHAQGANFMHAQLQYWNTFALVVPPRLFTRIGQTRLQAVEVLLERKLHRVGGRMFGAHRTQM